MSGNTSPTLSRFEASRQKDLQDLKNNSFSGTSKSEILNGFTYIGSIHDGIVLPEASDWRPMGHTELSKIRLVGSQSLKVCYSA